jgi:hypothetical protein
VEEAQRRIDSHQFTGWMAYHRLEPFGQDYLHLMLAQQLLATGNLRKGTRLADLLPGEDVPVEGDALRLKAESVFGALRATGAPRRVTRRRG